jgi:hypothetical protein
MTATPPGMDCDVGAHRRQTVRGRAGSSLFAPTLRLRIRRTSAYMLTHRWLETAGEEGTPAVRIGRNIRVPAAASDQWAHGLPVQS